MNDFQNSSPSHSSDPSPVKDLFSSLELSDENSTTTDPRDKRRPDSLGPRHQDLQLTSGPTEGKADVDAERAAPTKEEVHELGALPPLGVILYLNPRNVEVSPDVIGRQGSRDKAADEELIASIRMNRTNTVPVLVRLLPSLTGKGTRRQLVDGQRRLWACLEARVPLKAQVVELKNDMEVLRYVASSHAGYQERAPIAIGRRVKSWLEAKRFPTAAALCAFTGWDAASVSRCVSLAELPKQVTDLFEHSKGLQHRHAAPLKKLLADNREEALVRAETVAKLNEKAGYKMTAMELFDALFPRKPAPEKLKTERKVPCADCVLHSGTRAQARDVSDLPGAPNASNASDTPANWRSQSSTALPVVDDDGLELADVSTDADGFTRTRYSFRDLNEHDRDWLATAQLEMLKTAPFYHRAKAAKDGGTP